MAVGEAMMDETDVKRILSHDFSAHAGAFHDQLLARCLDELGQEKDADIIQLADSDLEMLAAAGSPEMLRGPARLGKDPEA